MSEKQKALANFFLKKTKRLTVARNKKTIIIAQASHQKQVTDARSDVIARDFYHRHSSRPVEYFFPLESTSGKEDFANAVSSLPSER